MSKPVYSARKKLLQLNHSGDYQSAIIWPQWTEQDQAEKWSVKGQFEDAEALPADADWFAAINKEWKRPVEFITEQSPVVVNALPATPAPVITRPPTESRISIDNSSEPSQSAATAESHAAVIPEAPDEVAAASPASVRVETNNSASVGPAQVLYSAIKLVQLGANHLKLFPAPHTCIFPKAKDGTPVLNPCGKYAVRLFWMGAWRRVIVDDKIPFEKGGNSIFEMGDSRHEIYALLIAKAVYKLTAHLHGLPDFDLFSNVVYALTGSLVEKADLNNPDETPNYPVFAFSSDLKSFFQISKSVDGLHATDLQSPSSNFRVLSNNGTVSLTNEFGVDRKLPSTYVVYNAAPKNQKSVVYQFDAEKTEPAYYPKSFLLQTNSKATVVGFCSDYIVSREKAPSLQIQSLSGDQKFLLHSSGACCKIVLSSGESKSIYRLVVDDASAFSVQVSVLDGAEIVLKDEPSASDLLSDYFYDVDSQLQNLTATSWCILNKTLLTVNQPTIVTAQLFIPNDLFGTCLRIVNNDTSKDVVSSNFEISDFMLEPNKTGYNIVADCRPVVDLASSKLKIRILGKPALPEIAVLSPASLQMQQIDEPYRHNKRGQIFRYFLGNRNCARNFVSVDAKFPTIPQARLRLQLLRGTEIVAETDFSENPVIVSALLQGQDPITQTSNSNDGMKKKAPSQAEPLTNTQAVAASVAHTNTKRYVIQAFLEHHEQFRSLCPETDKLKQKSAATAAATTAAAQKAGAKPDIAGGPSSLSIATGFQCKLRLSSTETASLDIVKDTEQDDRLKKLKEQWEQKQPGRLAKARESREQFYKAKPDDKPSAAVPIVSLDYINTMQELPEYKTFVGSMHDMLLEQKAGLATAKTAQLQPFVQLTEQIKAELEAENAQKLEYQKLVKEFKDHAQSHDRERQLAEEQRLAAEAEAAAAAQKAEEEAAAAKKNAKKGKK